MSLRSKSASRRERNRTKMFWFCACAAGICISTMFPTAVADTQVPVCMSSIKLVFLIVKGDIPPLQLHDYLCVVFKFVCVLFFSLLSDRISLKVFPSQT